MVEERKKRLEERKKQRKEDRRNAFYRQKEEDAQRIHEEQLKKGSYLPFINLQLTVIHYNWMNSLFAGSV